MNEAVEAFLNFHKSAEIRKISHSPRNLRAHWIFLRELYPRIRLSLLHAQGDASLFGMQSENHNLDGIPNLHQLGRMLFALRPAHFGNMHKAFDARIELHEGAIIRDPNHLSLRASA